METMGGSVTAVKDIYEFTEFGSLKPGHLTRKRMTSGKYDIVIAFQASKIVP